MPAARRLPPAALWLAVAAAAAASAPALAQSAPARDPAASPAPAQSVREGGLDFTLTARGDVAFSADLRNNPGEVAVYRAGSTLAVSGSPAENWRLAFELSHEASWYNFTNATTIIAGTARPFHEMHALRLTPTATHTLSKDWAYFFGGILDLSFERDADAGEGFTGGGFIAARYAVSDTLALSFGALAKTRLEKSVLFLPILGVEWKINDRVTLATRGLGGSLAYRMNDRWTFELFGEYQSREYRLDDTAPNIDGVLRDRRAPVGVGILWKPCDHGEVALRAGAIVYQQFRTDTATGVNLTEVRTEPTGFLSLTGTLTF